MRGRIPEATLAEIRERADIVEIVSAHVGLRKVGRNHVGLCPFHAEKTPSFTVNGERGIFHCFGCGAGGNVFTFLMRLENLAFPEIVERLARRYGVSLPERGEESGALRERENLLRLNDQAARFFQRYLHEAGEAQAARGYLAERGIGSGVSDRFMLGFAPAAGDVLVRRLCAAGQLLEPAVRLGLIGARTSGGGHYDRFRARLMFPITDSSGRVIGFGSRSVPGTASAGGDLPKYLNSPETPLYRKGAHLYGLAVARDAIRRADRALVVEGYFDVLALAEAGIDHAVAPLGTALTLTQLQVLRRFTRNVVAFFDADAAGEKAAERSLPTFLEAGLWGYAAFLPAGDDPDTFVRRAGCDATLALLAEARPVLDFYLDRAVPPASTPGERAGVAQQVARWLRVIADPFEYDITVRRAAERLGLAETLLRRQPARAGEPPAGQPLPTRASGPEPLLVELMLSDPAAAVRVAEADGVALFEDSGWRAIAEEIVSALQRGTAVDPATIISRLDETAAARITGRLLDEGSEPAETAAVVDGCLAALWRRARRRRRQMVLRQIREAETHGNQAAVEQGLRELQELRRDVHT